MPKFLQDNASNKLVSSIKYIIPQSTNSPSIHPTAVKESVEQVNQPTEIDKNTPSDLDDKDQTSESSSSTNDSEDEDQTDMEYVPQNEAFEQEYSKGNSPPGSQD